MSRSTRKTPIMGVCGGSDKYDKRIANRRLRRAASAWLRSPEESMMPLLREISNVWDMCKDGKHWFGSLDDEDRALWMRK